LTVDLRPILAIKAWYAQGVQICRQA